MIGYVLIYTLPCHLFGIAMLMVMPVVIFMVSRLLSFRHFRARKNNPIREGLAVGICWMLMAIALDIIILVYGFGIGWDFFAKANWTLPVGYLEYVVFCVAGALGVRQ